MLGTNHGASTTHYLATLAATDILKAGGNAIDAGVAAGLVLGIVESHITCFSGVAPMLIYRASDKSFHTIDGLGVWPASASCEYFTSRGHKNIPPGILQTITPGAPAAWIRALADFGTLSFREVASAAIQIAKQGFPVTAQLAHALERKANAEFRADPELMRVFFPNGRAMLPGDIFRQEDMGNTLQYLADHEAATAKRGRVEALHAVKQEFYTGDLAKKIVEFHQEQGGLLTRDDMAGYEVTVEPPLSQSYGNVDLLTCGPWCQGPMLLQLLNIIKESGRSNLQHNSTEYVHFVAEAFKLVAEDRELYYGDPKFTDVPLDRLLSAAHARELLEKIEAGRARILDQFPGATDAQTRNAIPGGRTFDTSYACVVDAQGNAISCTPSDGVLRNAPMIPGTGLIISARGLQSRVDPAHPSSVQPRKRPRLTPNPAMVVKDDEYIMPFGTPGADYQVQAMLQVFLNIQGFGMELQEAIEAPRFFSCSFPDSFSPHAYYPGVLQLESGFEPDVYDELAKRGHKVQPWPDSVWPQAGVCVVKRDVRTGLVSAGADCRKVSYAIVS